MNSTFVYCNGNPVRYVDPDGRESFFAGFIGYVKMVDEKIDQAFKGGSLFLPIFQLAFNLEQIFPLDRFRLEQT